MPPRLLLAIATSSEEGSVAVLDLARGPLSVVRYDGGRGHAERVLGAVDEALAAAGASKTSLVGLAVCTGPGSFTGVRAGVATVKGIAFALDLPVVAANALEVHAFRHGMEAPGVARAIAIDAKRDELFVAAFTSELAVLAAPALISAADLNAWVEALPEPCAVVGPYAAEAEAVSLAMLARSRLAEGRITNATELEPTYVRPPDLLPPKLTAP